MKTTRKILGILLCAFLCLGSSVCAAWTLPVTAEAAQPASPQLPAITSVVYFGGYQWWVVGNAAEGVYPQEDSLTLLAVNNGITKNANLEQSAFRVSKSTGPSDALYIAYEGTEYKSNPTGMAGWATPNEYAGSDLQSNMETLAASLPAEEQALIQLRTFEDGVSFDEWGGVPGNLISGIVGQGIANQKFWPLSYAEYKQLPTTEIKDYSDYYWLRSPVDKTRGGSEVAVGAPGGTGLNTLGVYDNVTDMRPAFSLDVSSALFLTGPKSSAVIGSGMIGAAAAATSSAPAKFTMLDTDLTLTVTATASQAAQSGTTLSFAYENAKGGTVSCILTDEDGAAKYYGKLADISATASGSLSIPLSGVADGSYLLYVFAEESSGDTTTDFCSAPVSMKLSVNAGTGTVSEFDGTLLHTHDWAAQWSGDGTNHWHECTAEGCNITGNSEKDSYGAHTGGTATCAARAVCQVCGLSYGNVDPDVHSSLQHVERKEATHMAVGNIEYWHCDSCGKYFRDAGAAEEITEEETILPKLSGHTPDGSGWHRDESSHWNTCACGEILNQAAHTFAWVTDKEATGTEAGSRHEECTVCGYEKKAEAIPPTGNPGSSSSSGSSGSSSGSGHSGSGSAGSSHAGSSAAAGETGLLQAPKTGDTTSLALPVLLCVVSGAVLAGGLAWNRGTRNGRKDSGRK